MIGGTVVIDLTVSAERWVPDDGRRAVSVVLAGAPAGVPVKVLVGQKWAPSVDFGDGAPAFLDESWCELVARHPVVVEGDATAVFAWVRYLRACEQRSAA
ncbi:MAG: hypothetical protein L6367_11185 [Cellulomonas sp.]|nr:hypothetical protein [Cellulomonas sp.]